MQQAGVGPVTALAFVLTIGPVSRFANSKGELAQSLLAEGLVDRIGLNIHPILLGAGIPTFRDPGYRVKLELMECRPLKGGCILAQYKVLQTR